MASVNIMLVKPPIFNDLAIHSIISISIIRIDIIFEQKPNIYNVG